LLMKAEDLRKSSYRSDKLLIALIKLMRKISKPCYILQRRCHGERCYR
jgi:hypothetical protein